MSGVRTIPAVMLSALLIIVAGLVITFTGISVGHILSRRVRSGNRAALRSTGGGLACGVAVVVGAMTIVLGIADGIFLLATVE